MIKFNEVTWYSKLAAVIFFIGILPVLAFYIGVQFQKTHNESIYSYKAESNDINQNTFVISTSTPAVVEGEIKYTTQVINGFQVPQIVEFSDIAIAQKVNAQLAEAANNFDCGDITPSPHDYFDAKFKVGYAKDDIFSVSIHIGYYCGGPYPTNDSNVSVVFDMKTGNPVPFKDLFSNYVKDKKNIMAIIFVEQIKKTSGTPSDGSCNGMYSLDAIDSKMDTLNFSEFISYHIEGDGVTAQPSFPHVIEVCSVENHASAEQLKAFFATSSILARIK